MDTVENADDKPFSLKQGTKNHVWSLILQKGLRFSDDHTLRAWNMPSTPAPTKVI